VAQSFEQDDVTVVTEREMARRLASRDQAKSVMVPTPSNDSIRY
jgi:hypothetical protein